MQPMAFQYSALYGLERSTLSLFLAFDNEANPRLHGNGHHWGVDPR